MAYAPGVYQVPTRPELFSLQNNQLRYVPTEQALTGLGYGWGDIQQMPLSDWAGFDIGAPISAPGWPTTPGYYPHQDWYQQALANLAPVTPTEPTIPTTPTTPTTPATPTGDWSARNIQFPTIAWGGTAPPKEEWPSYFQGLQEQGYNILGGVSHPVTDVDWWTQLAQAAAQSQIGIMPWAGKGQAGRADWWEPSGAYYGERLRPEWETWVSALAQEPSLYGFYAWEEPNVFRQMYGEPTPESMLEQYEALKRLAPEALVTGSLGLAESQYAANYPQTMDVIFPEYYVSESYGPEYWASQYQRLWEPMLSQFQGDVYPLILPSQFENIPMEEIISGWETLTGEPVTGLGYYPTVSGLSQDISQQIAAYNALMGGTSGAIPMPIPPVPPGETEPPKPSPVIPPDYVPPEPYIPPEGGETMAGEQYYYPTPYGFNIGLPPETYPSYVQQYPGETFPWARSYYPESIGPGGEQENLIPSFPSYRLFPYKPPTYAGEQYQGMQVPGTFFEGVTTPSLESYMAGQLGQYPTYEGLAAPEYPTYQAGQLGAYPTYTPHEGALAEPTQQAITRMLGGEGIGIPYEAQQYQTAMGRITEAERAAQEELTRLSARGGRIESGLYGAQQLEITQAGLEAKRGTAQEFAIRTAEMKQQAQQVAAPMAMQMIGMEAGEKTKAYESLARAWGEGTADKVREYEAAFRKTEAQYGAGAAQEQLKYQSRADAWGAETADLFTEYQSELETATTDYEMRTAQNEMIQAGEERAWQAANEEYTKQYQAAKEAGMNEYEAQSQAWSAALQQWETLYQSVVMAAQQEFQWVAQRRAWSEQRGQIVLGAHQASRMDVGNLLGTALTAFLGGGTTGGLLGQLGGYLGQQWWGG